MKKLVGLILIAVAVVAIAGLLAKSRRRDDSEEQAVEDTGTFADEDAAPQEEGTTAEAVAEPA